MRCRRPSSNPREVSHARQFVRDRDDPGLGQPRSRPDLRRQWLSDWARQRGCEPYGSAYQPFVSYAGQCAEYDHSGRAGPAQRKLDDAQSSRAVHVHVERGWSGPTAVHWRGSDTHLRTGSRIVQRDSAGFAADRPELRLPYGGDQPSDPARAVLTEHGGVQPTEHPDVQRDGSRADDRRAEPHSLPRGSTLHVSDFDGCGGEPSAGADRWDRHRPPHRDPDRHVGRRA